MNLVQQAQELLSIHQDFPYRLKNKKLKSYDFTLYQFEQSWGNTSGGFEGIGGCAITAQNTYVLIPTYDESEPCMVYFGGRYAYSVPLSKSFMDDVNAQNIAGVSRKGKYFTKE